MVKLEGGSLTRRVELPRIQVPLKELLAVTPQRLDQLQLVVRMIEKDGDEAFFTVANSIGHEAAMLLLILHLRYNFGSGATYPPPPGIDDKVKKHFQEIGLLRE